MQNLRFSIKCLFKEKLTSNQKLSQHFFESESKNNIIIVKLFCEGITTVWKNNNLKYNLVKNGCFA